MYAKLFLEINAIFTFLVARTIKLNDTSDYSVW